ncbi:decarboxylase [Nocardia speluncae]|uniref:Decarboxylase n=1 Tax=Nocardia speluncae TaxID=419477 RepID=A0A846X7B4_9NOCA|nr:alanine racemase [Nocardia speluncae]NKY31808.1 decarboxylase [Nocardia speluncae]
MTVRRITPEPDTRSAPDTALLPALPARWDPLVQDFLADRAALDRVADRFGTPLHLLFPQVFTDNLTRLAAVFDTTRVRYRICYAHKVNRSAALVRTASALGTSVDVASAGELESARQAGFTPDRIEVTGPKGEEFLRALADSGVTVNVDNQWELETLAGLARPAAPIPVLLRISGFPDSRPSRFGIPVSSVEPALDILTSSRDRLDFRGLAFHLDTGDIAERLRAAQTCFDLLERACARGLLPSVLNIGGGLRQVFTADARRFDEYVHRLRDGLNGRGPRMSWGATTFGYQVDGTSVRGTPVFHKYANTVAADDMLTEVLTAPLERHGGRGIGRVADDNLLEIWLEPGKALADLAGITLARVEFVKEAADGSVLVHLDLSRDSVTPADQEVMADPLLLPGRPPAPPAAPVGVYLAGRLCLERDLITAHKIWLPWLPRPGDLVVFPNTAAYHSDLSAAAAAMHPPAHKVAIEWRDGTFRATPDAEFRPVPSGGESLSPEVS